MTLRMYSLENLLAEKSLLGDLQKSEMTIQIQSIHADKWFQQHTNSGSELNPDSDKVMADSAVSVIIEKW